MSEETGILQRLKCIQDLKGVGMHMISPYVLFLPPIQVARDLSEGDDERDVPQLPRDDASLLRHQRPCHLYDALGNGKAGHASANGEEGDDLQGRLPGEAVRRDPH